MSKKIDYFLRNLVRREREESAGSISIHFLSFIGMMLGKSTGSLLCGFAFAFDLAAKPSQSVVTLVLQVDLQELLCCCSLNHS